jgi:bacterioferritin-associated ferredoxin
LKLFIDNHYHLDYYLQMIVCVCKSVSDREIELAIDTGKDTFDALQDTLGVGSQCGSCSCEVRDMIKTAKMSNREDQTNETHMAAYSADADGFTTIRVRA